MREQRESIGRKLSNLDMTLGRLLAMPGLTPDLMDRAVALQARTAKLETAVGELWDSIGRPATEAIERKNALARRLDSLQRDSASARRRAEAAAAEVKKLELLDPHHPVLTQQEITARALEQAAIGVERELDAAAGELPIAEAASAAAMADLNVVQSLPDPRFDKAKNEVDTLLAETAIVFAEATTGRSLAQEGVDVVKANKQEFTSALNHHRDQAKKLFRAMVVAATVLGLLIALMFLLPKVIKKLDPGTSSSDWMFATLMLGGRISLVIGGGWLVAFFGRLHSKHSQQAVSYQDRLAGLDAADVIIKHGTAASREEVLKQMTATYIRLDANAFQAPPPAPVATAADVEKVLKATLDPVASVLSSALKK